MLEPFTNASGRLAIVCGNEEPCFEGPHYLPEGEGQYYSLDVERLAALIAKTNALRPIAKQSPQLKGCWFVGMREVRNSRVIIFLLGEALTPALIEEAARIASVAAGRRSAILHGGCASAACQGAASKHGVALFQLPGGESWDLKLDWLEIADAVNPDYLPMRSSNGEFIFEDVRMELASEPGIRHRVIINGRECRGFADSGAKFSRLLLLAAKRKVDNNRYFGGWTPSDDLRLDAKGKQLGEIRDALAKNTHCGLPAEDLRLLVRAHPEGTGEVRLALLPENIDLDASLKVIVPLQAVQNRGKSGTNPAWRGAKKQHANMKIAANEAQALFVKALQLLDS